MQSPPFLARAHAVLTATVFTCLAIAAFPFLFFTWPDVIREHSMWGVASVPLLVAGPVLAWTGVQSVLRSAEAARSYGMTQGIVLALFVVGTLLIYAVVRADGTGGSAAWLGAAVAPALGPVFVPPAYLIAVGWQRVASRMPWRTKT